VTEVFGWSPRHSWAMVARNRDVYLKTWKTNFLPPLVEPVLYLFSFGYGVGAFVPDIGGVSYRQFIVAAILAMTMMQSAFYETTYGSFVRMQFQHTWEAVTATPLSLEDVLVGEVVWAAIKSTINTLLMAVVVAMFGLFPWAFLPALAPLAFVTGLLFAGLGLLISSRVRNIDAFSYSVYLLVTPMMLFSGTFFPLDRLPGAFVAVAKGLPLTYAVLETRAMSLGSLNLPWTGLAYLLAGAILIPALAVASMRRRLIV
jgi:lipooligosaccharide transport system permease protein